MWTMTKMVFVFYFVCMAVCLLLLVSTSLSSLTKGYTTSFKKSYAKYMLSYISRVLGIWYIHVHVETYHTIFDFQMFLVATVKSKTMVILTRHTPLISGLCIALVIHISAILDFTNVSLTSVRYKGQRNQTARDVYIYRISAIWSWKI